MSKKTIYVLFCIFLMYGCNADNVPINTETSSTPINIETNEDQNEMPDAKEAAEATLYAFHDLLNAGDYEQAVSLFGGSYEMLEDYNPNIEPLDKVGLLEAGCQFNGLVCLQVFNAGFVRVIDQHEFVYEVTFKNADETPFEMGPCCGEDEDDMALQSIFVVHVVCDVSNSCQVMDLPPYVP